MLLNRAPFPKPSCQKDAIDTVPCAVLQKSVSLTDIFCQDVMMFVVGSDIKTHSVVVQKFTRQKP